jgi:hypothetical protein
MCVVVCVIISMHLTHTLYASQVEVPLPPPAIVVEVTNAVTAVTGSSSSVSVSVSPPRHKAVASRCVGGRVGMTRWEVSFAGVEDSKEIQAYTKVYLVFFAVLMSLLQHDSDRREAE